MVNDLLDRGPDMRAPPATYLALAHYRTYSLEFKCQVAQQSLSGGIDLAALSRQHDICRLSPALVKVL